MLQPRLLKLFNYCPSFSADVVGPGYYNFLHSQMDGIEGILEFWNHTAGDYSRCLVIGKVLLGNNGNHALIIIGIPEHTFFLETEGQRKKVPRRRLPY